MMAPEPKKITITTEEWFWVKSSSSPITQKTASKATPSSAKRPGLVGIDVDFMIDSLLAAMGAGRYWS